MSNTESNGRTVGGTIYGLFWIFNFIYTIMYWGGWAILWNFFLPYSFLWDLATKAGRLK